MNDLDIRKWIFPIEYSNATECSFGVGFLVGNLFITSGHLLGKGQTIIKIDQQYLTFRKEDAILFNSVSEDQYNADCIDIAVFRVKGFHSPFILANCLPQNGDILMCHTFQRNVKVNNVGQGVFNSFGTEIIDYFKCQVTVNYNEGKFLVCNTSELLKEGNSGSPIVCGNEVFGVLDAGTPGKKECIFQSSVSILKELN